MIPERLEAILIDLPPQKVEQVIDFATYLKSKEQWEATQELMLDPGMKEDIDAGKRDAIKGNVKSWREIKKNV